MPVTIVIVIFAIANRQAVTIDLWPFDQSISQPLFLVVLVAVLVGFCVGAAVMWLSDGRVRNRARENYYKASHLEREVAALKRKQEQSARAREPNLPVAHQNS